MEKNSITRRVCTWSLGLFGLMLATSSPMVHAQTFPSKPIRMVIGFPAGGPLDQHARLLSDKLPKCAESPGVQAGDE